MAYKRLTNKERAQEIRGILQFLRNDEEKIYLRLAELEDKIEDGQAVILQCKPGDTVYVVHRSLRCPNDVWIVLEEEIYSVTLRKNGHIEVNVLSCFGGFTLTSYEIGKDCFLFREQAEAKCEELQNLINTTF